MFLEQELVRPPYHLLSNPIKTISVLWLEDSLPCSEDPATELNDQHLILLFFCRIYVNIIPPYELRTYKSPLPSCFQINIFYAFVISAMSAIWPFPCYPSDSIILTKISEEFNLHISSFYSVLQSLLTTLPLRFKCCSQRPVLKHKIMIILDFLNCWNAFTVSIKRRISRMLDIAVLSCVFRSEHPSPFNSNHF